MKNYSPNVTDVTSIGPLLNIGRFILFENNDKSLKFSKDKGAATGNRVHFIGATPLNNFDIRARHVRRHVKPYISLKINVLDASGAVNEFMAILFVSDKNTATDSICYKGSISINVTRVYLTGVDGMREDGVRFIDVHIIRK